MHMSDCEIRDLEDKLADCENKVAEVKMAIKEKNFYFWLLMIWAAVASIGLVLACHQREEWKDSRNTLRQELLDKGYARYNPTNATFEVISGLTRE